MSSERFTGEYVCSQYVGTPVFNDCHMVVIASFESTGELRWSDKAGVSWGLTIDAHGNLCTGEDCPVRDTF